MIDPVQAAQAFKDARVIHCTSHLEILLQGRSGASLTEEWMKTFSRAQSLPVCFIRENGRYRIWYTQGVLHNPFGPSLIEDDGAHRAESWTDMEGKPHNLVGPAIYNHRYCVSYHEDWSEHGDRPTKNRSSPVETVIYYASPYAKTYRDYLIQTQQEMNNFIPHDTQIVHIGQMDLTGMMGRESGPYTQSFYERAEMIEVDSNMLMSQKIWAKRSVYTYYDGYGKTRVNGPAEIWLMGEQTVLQADAVKSHSFLDWSAKWYYHNQEIQLIEIKEWARRQGITIRDVPDVYTSSFMSIEDEKRFQSEFLNRRG